VTVDARVAILDVMRGFAAAAVAWFHFTHAGGLLEDGWLKGSGSYGWLGVEVFFVISGFVLPYSLWKGRYRLGDDTATFLVKRLVRLEPPYLITLAITVGLLYGSAATPGFRGPPPNVSPAQLLLHVGYLNSYFGYPSLSPVFWTLAIELQFYLLLAFTYPLVSNQSRGATVLLPATLACLALALPHDLLVLQYLGLFGLGINAFRFYARLHGRLAFFAISGVLTAHSRCWSGFGHDYSIRPCPSFAGVCSIRGHVVFVLSPPCAHRRPCYKPWCSVRTHLPDTTVDAYTCFHRLKRRGFRFVSARRGARTALFGALPVRFPTLAAGYNVVPDLGDIAIASVHAAVCGRR
jgi:peptidoglycan/LPS O-acetylase OafA/YrhL